MERSGMRWTQVQAQSMLDLRALHESSNWDSFHSQRVAHASHHDRLQALIGYNINLPRNSCSKFQISSSTLVLLPKRSVSRPICWSILT